MIKSLSKRQLLIEITKLDENGNIEFQKSFANTLNARFNFQKYIGNIMYGSGKVSICGLDKDTIQVLTGLGSAQEELAKRRIIRLKAGYEGEQLGLMVNGTIQGAKPTMPPDIWLDCDVINNYEVNYENIAFSTKESMKIKDYILLVADTLGLTPEIRIKDDNFLACQISKQSVLGNSFNLVYSIRQAMKDISAYIENETLIIDYATQPPQNDERFSNPIEINKDTGMVGMPELFNAGQIANITTLLDTSIKTGSIINLKSSQIPSANGLFYVIGITYTGEFRGTNWYSMFHCRRIK